MTMISKSRAVAKNFISLILLSVNTLAFADGPFDPTFAGDGLFPYSYLFGEDVAENSGIARDSLGRLIVATSVGHHAFGKYGLAATRHISDSGASLLPHPIFSDGLPDISFGTNGIASGFLDADSDSYATAIAVDHQDRIIVGGSANGLATCSGGSTIGIGEDTLVRIRNDKGFDGQADFSFGGFGVANYGDCSHDTNGISAIAVDKDDNIVATGSVRQGGPAEVSVVRWTSGGQLDNTFGNVGATSAAFMGNNTIGNAVAIDSAGRILVAAQASTDDGMLIGLLTRFTSDGKLDTTFGSDGYAQLGTIGQDSLGYLGHVCCIAIDSRNRAIVAGSIVTTSPDDSEASEQSAFVARFTEKGTPDETFGQHGFVYPSSDQMTEADALAIDKEDRPVIGGDVRSSYFPRAVSVLSHFNLDGSLNKAVGFGGIYTAAFGFSGSYVTSMLIDGLGRPTLTAIGDDSDTREVPVLIRYDEMFGDGFD